MTLHSARRTHAYYRPRRRISLGASHSVSCVQPFTPALSDDIFGLDIYVSGLTTPVNGVLNSRNLSIYISPTSVYRNGSLCVSNYNATNSAAVANRILCGFTLANARYVTIERFITAAAPTLSLYEVQILRSGKDGSSRPWLPGHIGSRPHPSKHVIWQALCAFQHREERMQAAAVGTAS